MTDLATGFKRLRTALRPKEDIDGRMGTHGPGCYSWGRGHYECALAEIKRLRADAHPPQQRPPTPTGWSDTDWIAHLAVTPPIGYATRDHLYGTSAAGVLRFCPHDEPGAFAVYAAPQRKPLTDEQIRALPAWWPSYEGHTAIIELVRSVERAHGIGEKL